MDNYKLSQTALAQGIKLIGIGKHGSKDLPEVLIDQILDELRSGKGDVLQKGAFFGALLTKGPARHEYALEAYLGQGAFSNPAQLYAILCADSPEYMQEIGVKLLSLHTLTIPESEKLGTYLFSNLPGETFRGMAASILRIRYETSEEYLGLIRAAEASFLPGFQSPPVSSSTLIQLAEPFDGVEHSYIITPLLAQALQENGYTVIATTGRSGGPKLTLNALDIYQGLGAPFLKSNSLTEQPPPPYGWALHQQDLSPALDAWVDRRLHMIKRPFLATMEKVLNPCQAHVLITSVFHITYMEKMIELADMTGFAGVIVLKRGLEGTLAPSIARASGILCAAKQADGNWLTQSFDADSELFADYRADSDAVLDELTLEDNLGLIRTYAAKGETGNDDFDKRFGLAVALYRMGLTWIEESALVSSQ